ncbi:MAG TPA: type IV secretory system conjugative DNA transfer family protein, partial [Candidatus Borkfalkia faecavium]|nr:type IV secretory system conjugative DNA transfer family protein [Candidatus Borkfalkia faecavium]
WLTIKRLKKLKEFTVTTWEKMPEHDDEIVIGAEKKGKGLEIISTSALHALIVGTTGSGKTTGFVDQNIAILGKSRGKPSMIIADPKKELYEKHAKQLESEGYKISTLDLREPYSSARWNPMQVLIRRIRQVKELQNDLKQEDGKYYACGEVFLSHRDARTRVQELKDEIFENAMDLVYTLCPVQNKDQPTWEEGARNLIFGLVLAFCEDVISGKMDEKQLQLFNVYHNVTKYCSEDTTALKQYLLEGRDEFSKVRGLVNTVLITSDKTLTSYLSEVNSYMQQLSDDGILSMTSENDIDIANMDESPNALFVIVPDERFTRHRFVTLFLTQTYKELVEKANTNLRKKQTDTAILKRRAYYILDEFANLPKMENIEGMVTVGRSRGIRYLFVLQSFSQLNAKYGKDVADILKSNCNVKLFIGSDDAETRKEFSELCGQKKVKSFSVNTSAENPASSNTGASNQPLITPGMLERLNGDEKGDAIVSVRGYEPIWTRFTSSYELKHIYFAAGKADIGKREARLFDKSQYVFDICGGSQAEEEERQLIAIEQREREETGSAPNIAELDAAWSKQREAIRKKVSSAAAVLGDEDAQALVEAKLENKQMLIALLLQEYTDLSVRQKLNTLSAYLSEALPKLLELQEKVRNS